VRRREFMVLLGTAAAWPLTAHAQQMARLPTIGFLRRLASNGRRVALCLHVEATRTWLDQRPQHKDRYALG